MHIIETLPLVVKQLIVKTIDQEHRLQVCQMLLNKRAAYS